jgi:hypothetical protein
MQSSTCTRTSALPPHTPHARNKQREPIDCIWVSKGITPIASGFLAIGEGCPTDHIVLWVDFLKEDLLGAKRAPLVFNVKKLKADDPRLVSKYNKKSKQALAKQQGKHKLLALSAIPRRNWNDTHTAEFDALHRINNEVQKEIVENLRKVCLGNLPWSPQFQRFYDKIELMKLLVSKPKGVRSSMTKIRRLA